MLSNILNLHPEILSLSEFFSMQGLRSLLPGELTGTQYWEQLATQTRTMRVVSTSETAPTEFLYDESMGRFAIDKVPPLMISVLPHLTRDPQALYDELAQVVELFPKQVVEAHHEMVFQWLTERLERKVWVERTGLSQMYAKLLPDLFPDAKFVLLYRDGRDVALSMQAFKPIRPAIWNWKWFRKLGSNPIDINNPAGRSRSLRFIDRFLASNAFIRWMVNHPPPLKDCAEFWSELMLTSLSAFSLLPAGRRHWLDYEQLVCDPRAEIRSLGRFLGVADNAEWLHRGSLIPKPFEARWNRLDAAMQNDLARWTRRGREAALACSLAMYENG